MAAEETTTHRTWKLIGGSVVFLLGLAALGAAAVTSLAVVMMFGWILIIGGVIGLIASFAITNGGGLILGIVSSFLSIVVGLLMILNPGISLATLTLLLAVYFVVDGAIRIAVAFTAYTDNRGWSLFEGVIMLALGFIIWTHLAGITLYIFGIFIGISLLLKGAAIVATSVTPIHLGGHRPRYA